MTVKQRQKLIETPTNFLLSIPAEYKLKLKILAATKGITVAKLIRDWIDN